MASPVPAIRCHWRASSSPYVIGDPRVAGDLGVLHRGDDRRDVRLAHQPQGDDAVARGPRPGTRSARGLMRARSRGRRRPVVRRPPGRPAAAACPTSSPARRRRPGPPSRRATRPGEPAELGDVGAQRLGGRARPTTTSRASSRSAVARGDLDRRVLAEIGDPPAAGAQREPERDQAEVVLLARVGRRGRRAARCRCPSPARGRPGARGPGCWRSAPRRSRSRRAPSARRSRASPPVGRRRAARRARARRPRGRGSRWRGRRRAPPSASASSQAPRGDRRSPRSRDGPCRSRLARADRAASPAETPVGEQLGHRPHPCARRRASRGGSRPASAPGAGGRNGAPTRAACRRRPRAAGELTDPKSRARRRKARNSWQKLDEHLTEPRLTANLSARSISTNLLTDS